MISKKDLYRYVGVLIEDIDCHLAKLRKIIEHEERFIGNLKVVHGRLKEEAENEGETSLG